MILRYVKNYKMSEDSRGKVSVEYDIKVAGTELTLIQTWDDPKKPLEGGFGYILVPNPIMYNNLGWTVVKPHRTKRNSRRSSEKIFT